MGFATRLLAAFLVIGLVSAHNNNGCPDTAGYFQTPYPYNQCFKFLETPVNWDEANKACENQGLVLARPYETIDLKNYLVMKYGDLSLKQPQGGQPVTAWLGAKTNGRCMQWNRDPYSACISKNLPLWWPDQASKVATGFCLLLTSNADDWKRHPEQSFYALPCGDNRYPLCELLK